MQTGHILMKLLQSFNPTLNGMDSAAMVLFMPEQINELAALLKTFLNQIGSNQRRLP